MDQTGEIFQFRQRLNSANISGTSQFNFSNSVAMEIIKAYQESLTTIHRPQTIALVSFYIPVFLAALGGNGLVVFVVFRNPHMRKVKNLFLVNLAFADLLVTLMCMPMAVATTVYRLWIYGGAMCKMVAFMQGVAVVCSIFTLTALSIDRYFAIKSPTHCHRITGKCQATKLLAVIWLLSALITGPILYVKSLDSVSFPNFPKMEFCVEMWPKHGNIYRQSYGIFLLFVVYVVPVLIVTVCYIMIGNTLCSDEFHRRTSDHSATVMLGRKRVARMLIGLILVFIFCWLPYNITSLSADLNTDPYDLLFLPFTLLLGHAHSALNPVLYWFLNKSFRHCMRKALRCGHVLKSNKDSPSPQYV